MIESYRAAALDPSSYLNPLQLISNGPVRLDLISASSEKNLIEMVKADRPPDIILLDVEMPSFSGLEIAKKLREASPSIPILLMSTNPNWSDLLGQDSMIDMVRSPIDPNEVWLRISRLVQSFLKNPNRFIGKLRNDNGLIDAKKIAKLFDLSIPVLANILQVKEQAVYKTPTARSLQSQLLSFEKIACGLLRLTGSEKGLRIWLNAPNPELNNELPIDYIKTGYVEDIAAMVEDTLTGHPS